MNGERERELGRSNAAQKRSRHETEGGGGGGGLRRECIDTNHLSVTAAARATPVRDSSTSYQWNCQCIRASSSGKGCKKRSCLLFPTLFRTKMSENLALPAIDLLGYNHSRNSRDLRCNTHVTSAQGIQSHVGCTVLTAPSANNRLLWFLGRSSFSFSPFQRWTDNGFMLNVGGCFLQLSGVSGCSPPPTIQGPLSESNNFSFPWKTQEGRTFYIHHSCNRRLTDRQAERFFLRDG